MPGLDARRVFETADTRNRSIGRSNVECSRLTASQAQQPMMLCLVRRLLMFRAITQAKEHPPLPVGNNPRRQEVIDHEKGVPVYSFLLRCE